MEVNMRKEGYQVPQVEFIFREDGQFITRTSSNLFDNKRVVIFTPICAILHTLEFTLSINENALPMPIAIFLFPWSKGLWNRQAINI